MQNRYAADIGDFAKLGILRAITDTASLGVAWYMYPDEGHNSDGKHIAYLDRPARWRYLDTELFDMLGGLVRSKSRSLEALERAGILPSATFSRRPLDFDGPRARRQEQRDEWFQLSQGDLAKCSVIFADPDNGLCADLKYAPARRNDWKRIPLREALSFSENSTAIIYHHNTRRAGGHSLEIQYWLAQMGPTAFALYWRPYSPRTFFVINPTALIQRNSEALTDRWAPHLEYHQLNGDVSKIQ